MFYVKMTITGIGYPMFRGIEWTEYIGCRQERKRSLKGLDGWKMRKTAEKYIDEAQKCQSLSKNLRFAYEIVEKPL